MSMFVTLGLKLVFSAVDHALLVVIVQPAYLSVSKLNKLSRQKYALKYNAHGHKLFYRTNKAGGLEIKK